jgi:WD40 repeat protein
MNAKRGARGISAGPAWPEVRLRDSAAALEVALVDGTHDLALLYSPEDLVAPVATWMDDPSLKRWLSKNRDCSATGYSAKRGLVGRTGRLSLLTHDEGDVQVLGGIAEGYSGGMLGTTLGDRDVGVGLLQLGGRGVTTSIALLASELQAFLERSGTGLKLTRVEWGPSPSTVFDLFEGERSRHKQRFGREDLLARLRGLLDFEGWVILKGAWGLGKSAMMHYLLQELERVSPVPHHFIRRGRNDWDEPRIVAHNLCRQLRWLFSEAEQMPEETGLLDLLQVISRQVLVPQHRSLTLFVDGLDEIRSLPQGNPLSEFLPHPLPPRVTFFVASRPADPHLTLFAEQRRVEIDLNADPSLQESSAEACRRYLTHLGASPEVVRRLTESAEGKFLICQMVPQALGNDASTWTIQQLSNVTSKELRDVYESWWSQRVTYTRDWPKVQRIKKALGFLCASREGLPRRVLKSLCGTNWSPDEFRETMLPLLASSSEGEGESFRIDHDSLREFFIGLLDEPEASARKLADALCRWPAVGAEFTRRYALRYALRHWRELGEWQKFEGLALDARYWGAVCSEVGIDALSAEFDGAVEALGTRAPSALRTLRRFARARAHVLRWHPSMLDQDFDAWCAIEGIAAEGILAHLERPKVRLRGGAVWRDGAELVLIGHSGFVNACAVTPDGQRAVSASGDNTMRVWDLVNGKLIHTLQGHSGPVTACALTADGRRVVSASGDNTLRVWDLVNGRLIHTLQGHSAWFTACALTTDGQRVVSASRDNALRVWDLVNGRLIHTLQGHAGPVTACALTADGQRALSASTDNTLRVWDLVNGQLSHTLQGHAGPVTACALTADGQRAASASRDNTLRVWDLVNGKLIHTLKGHSHTVNACAVTADGQRALSASDDNTLRVWDLVNGKLIHTLEGRLGLQNGHFRVLGGHWGRVNACAVTADGQRALSASGDDTLRVWDLVNGTLIHTLGALGVNACAVTADGQRALSASDDNTLRVWDLVSGKLIHTLEGHSAEVYTCVVTADGQRAVSASNDHTLRVWDLVNGKLIHTLQGHSDSVIGCALHPDGHRAVSASVDNTLRWWDLDRGALLHTFAGTAGFTTVAASSNGATAAGDKAGNVWLLDVAPELWSGGSR